MSRLLAIAVVSAAVTMLTMPLLSALGPVAMHVNLTCMLVVALVMSLRPQDAVAAAVGGGLVADLLTATTPLVHVALLAAVAAVVALLGGRVFSHLSLGAFAGLNAISFLLYEATWGGFVRLAARVGGHASAPVAAAGYLGFFYGLLAQVATALVLLLLFRQLRKFASPFIFIRSSS